MDSASKPEFEESSFEQFRKVKLLTVWIKLFFNVVVNMRFNNALQLILEWHFWLKFHFINYIFK